MMLHFVSLLFLAFAVSLDGFGVGVTYGMRKIRIPILSIVIIACCSGLVIGIAMLFGQLLAGYLSQDTAGLIGAALLIGIGGLAIYQFWRGRREQGREDIRAEPTLVLEEQATDFSTVLRLELKRLGIVIQILRTPQAADVDRSGTISASEAVLLGSALSLDAFGAGLGAALLGFSPWLTSLLIAVSCGIFLLLGLRVGFHLSRSPHVRALAILPGLILIIMGIMKLL